jgi:hypothetical protein
MFRLMFCTKGHFNRVEDGREEVCTCGERLLPARPDQLIQEALKWDWQSSMISEPRTNQMFSV